MLLGLVIIACANRSPIRSNQSPPCSPGKSFNAPKSGFIWGILKSKVSDYMAIHRPSLFNDSDMLTFRQTPASEYRIPFTFVESLNEGTLFDRSARTFEEAARTQRLYDVVVGEDQRIIGAGMLQDTSLFHNQYGVIAVRSFVTCVLHGVGAKPPRRKRRGRPPATPEGIRLARQVQKFLEGRLRFILELREAYAHRIAPAGGSGCAKFPGIP